MSQKYLRVYWLDACEAENRTRLVRPEWDILVTLQINPVAIRVMRPFIAGILTLSLMQALSPVKESEPNVAHHRVIRIPAA